MDNSKQVEDMESALIGACLRDGKQFEKAREIVKPETFGNVALGYAWLAMEHLHDNGMGIDTITVGDELERMGKIDDFTLGSWNGRALLSWIRDEGEPRNTLSYAENVQDLHFKRMLDPFFTKCVMWSKNGRRAKDILSDVESELGKITLYSVQDEFTVPMSVAVSEAYDWTDQASQGKIIGVSTGFIDLDAILGSLYPENVYIIAARPGQGKTALLLSIAKNAAKEQKKRVAIFSLEMSRSQVAQRLISQEAEVDLNNITRGKMREDDWPKYTQGVEIVADLPIVINDLSSININQIRQTARKIKQSGGLDLILIDYIQLADSGEKNKVRELDVSAVSRGLKYLARELNVPILAAAQLSRAVEQRADKRPVLSDLRESGTLEQDAYGVMFIYMKEEEVNVTEIIVAKHRNGPVGSCELVFMKPYTKFKNASSKIFRPNEAYNDYIK